jgi:hypothetical protein
MLKADSEPHEDHPTPSIGSHSLQIGPRDPNASHHVHLPVPFPDGISGLEEVDRLEDASIAHHDIEGRLCPYELRRAFRSGKVDGLAASLAAELRHGGVHLGLSPPIDNNYRAGVVQTLGDGKSNALG